MSTQIKIALMSLAFEYDDLDDDDSFKKRKRKIKYKGLSKSEMLMKQDIDALKVFAKKSNISFSNNISKKTLIDRIVENRKLK